MISTSLLVAPSVARAVKDGEVVPTARGGRFGRVRVAFYGGKDEESFFVNVSAWDDPESCAEIKKGDLVRVQGTLVHRSWTPTNDNVRRTDLQLNVSKVEMVQTKADEQADEPF